MSGRIVWAALLIVASTSVLHAQQSRMAVPLQSAGSSFHENIGLSWGLHGKGWFFHSGGPAPMPFGGVTPGGGSTLGGGFQNGNLNGSWRLSASQGSDRSLVGQSPSVTLMNGGTGYFSDTVQRPFVMGLVPVVGGIPTPPPQPMIGGRSVSPVLERLARLEAEGDWRQPASRADSESDSPMPPSVNKAAANGVSSGGASSAARSTLSVAAIRAEQTSAESAIQLEIAQHIAKAKSLEAEGKPAIAKIYYRMAARRASGEQQQQLQAKLHELEAVSPAKR